MWLPSIVVCVLFTVDLSHGSTDAKLGSLLQENSDLREENAAYTLLQRELTDLRGEVDRRLQDCVCDCPCVTEPPSSSAFWRVTSGDRVIDSGCLSSGNYPLNYFDGATCSVEILSNWTGYIDVVDFELETFWDYLYVNGEEFTGSVDWLVWELQGRELEPNSNITFSADYATNEKGFKLCRSLDQVTGAKSTVPATQQNPSNVSFNQFWGVTEGECYMDTSGCICSPNFHDVFSNDYPASSTCEIEITDSWHGGTLLVRDFETEHGYDELYVNDRAYSGEFGGDGEEDLAQLQGLVPTTRILWSVDENYQRTGWRVCREEAASVEWIDWTCTLSGAPCTSFTSHYPMDVCDGANS